MKKTKNLTFDGERWGYDFTKKGKRIRAGGFMTKAQAEVTLTRLKIRKMDEALGLVKPAAEDVPFEAFADIFLETHSKQSKRSWKSDERSLENLKRAFKGETLASIGPEKVERYRAARKVEASKISKLGKPISPASCNRELACLKTLFSKAVEWGRIEVNPAARVKKLKEPPGRETILTEDQARRLVAAAGSEFRPVLIVALGTAMRRGEILALKWADLDLIRGIITITNSKSGRSRKIPMSGTVASALGGIPRHGEFVFWNPETKTQIKDVKTAWAAACARAKITGVRFHDCRHTALTWMLQSGADIVSVSKIAGHASIVMTQRYCHASPELQRLAVNKVGEILEPTRQKVDTPRVPLSQTTPQVVEKKVPLA
ncbi:MAG: site-specific integrase [Acidobacteria bacterium]|nr:site-specific integrase [Acidobacteriota bacterium]